MSLTEACVWSFVRAIVIAGVSLPIAVWIAGLLRTTSRLKRGAVLAAVLVPFLMPELLIGFVYSETTLRMVRVMSDPTAVMAPPTQLRLPQTMTRPINSADITAEALYALLLLCRFVPVAALAMWLMPAPRLSAEAIHCARLLRADGRNQWNGRGSLSAFACFVRGPLMATLPAFAIVFLLAFQEFEIASLMQISRAPIAWTVWLFDNHAGGLVLSNSLQLTIGPVLCELFVVGSVFVVLLRGDWQEAESLQSAKRVGILRSWLAIGFMLVAVLLAVAVPMWRLGSGASTGLAGLLRQSAMLMDFTEELFIALAFGLTAALMAYWLTGLVFDSRRRTAIAIACVVPGLIGSLVLSLVGLAFFQMPAMNAGYDTPLPMLLVLTMFLLPRAVLLRLVFFSRQPGQPIFIANAIAESGNEKLRSAGHELLWVLQKRPAFWVVVLLTYWGYWDLTVASILRPTNLEPFTPGLYNLMHYGRNETLTAMTMLAGIFPVAIVALMGLSRRLWRTVT